MIRLPACTEHQATSHNPRSRSQKVDNQQQVSPMHKSISQSEYWSIYDVISLAHLTENSQQQRLVKTPLKFNSWR